MLTLTFWPLQRYCFPVTLLSFRQLAPSYITEHCMNAYRSVLLGVGALPLQVLLQHKGGAQGVRGAGAPEVQGAPGNLPLLEEGTLQTLQSGGGYRVGLRVLTQVHYMAEATAERLEFIRFCN